jgi:HlyD family secretion protein
VENGTIGFLHMSVRRSLILLFIFVMVAPFVVFINAQSSTTSGSSQRLESLQVYRVGRGDVELSVSAIGTLEAAQDTNLSFTSGGRITDVYVQRDDYVLAGDPLVRLESTVQQLAYEQAVLNLENAELALQDLLTIDENQLALAQAAVDSALGGYYSLTGAVRPEDIQAAQLAYDQALINFNDAELARNTAQPGEFQLLDAELGESSFNLEIARLQLEQIQNGNPAAQGAAWARVEQAQAELARLQAGPTQSQIDAAQSSIDRAEIQLEQATDDLGRTTLVAPYDGVVATLNAEVGSLAAPGTTVVQLVDISPLQLAVQVDEVDVRLIDVGLPVRVRLDALQDVILQAEVTRIADAGTNVNGIVTYDVQIELLQEDQRARVGMTADATIVIEQKTDSVFIPNLYIRIDRFTGEAFVNVLSETGMLTEIPVTIGLQGQENSEVLRGLEVDDLIAIDLGGGGLNEFLGG